MDYDSSIDVWSFGCVLAEMFIGKPLFQGESTIEQLLQIIKQRHDNEENKLNHEIFIQNNQEWRNILKQQQKQQQQVELSNNQETIQQQLTNECLQRTKEFEHIIDVLKNQQPLNSLNDIINETESRHELMKNNDDLIVQDNQSWEDIIKKLKQEKIEEKQITSNNENISVQSDDGEYNNLIVYSNTDYNKMINAMMEEQLNRVKDFKQIQSLNNNNNNEFNNIINNINERHNNFQKKYENKFKGKLQIINQQMNENNEEWKNEIKEINNNLINNKEIKNCNDYYFKEIEGRVNDLVKLKKY